MRLYGKVTRCFPDRGYAFILGEDKNSYFAHYSNLNGEHIEKGYYVFFAPFQNDRSDYNAAKITVINAPEKVLRQPTVTSKKKKHKKHKACNAYKVYNGIRARCGDTKDNDNVRDCYDKSTMWQVWLDDPKEFVKWYFDHFYLCGDEEMDVDKDLFGDGSGMYAPDFCCILQKGLNTLLANSKKHYKEGETPENTLPLGVNYNSRTNKYYGVIQFTGTERQITLSEWNTPEEAFAEYKVMKQADILMVAAKYKESIPDYIYDRLLTVEVKLY